MTQLKYQDLILELKRVHRLYAKKDLRHVEAIRVLKNLCDLYGLSVSPPRKIGLKNHI